LWHNNARYKIQLTLVSQYHYRCILYLALLCHKSGISSTHDFGIEHNNSGIEHTSTLVQQYNNATIINTLIILVALRHDFLIIQLLLINNCYRLSSSYLSPLLCLHHHSMWLSLLLFLCLRIVTARGTLSSLTCACITTACGSLSLSARSTQPLLDHDS
jgi:hypothetical protein